MKRKVLPIRELFKFTPEELRDNLHTDLDILFEDDVVIHMNYREIILTRFIMGIYDAIPNVKIVSKHCIKNYYTNNFLTSKTINTALEHVIKDVVEIYCKPNNDRSILDLLYYNMQQLFNYIYNRLTYVNQAYCNSITVNDLLEIQMVPELLEAIKDVNVKRDYPSVTRTYEVLDKIIRTDKRFTNNVISKGYISGAINANQVKQLLASRGYIAELNKTIFKYPIASSFTLGMSNIYELAIESRSGAKALEMSHKAIQDSEYFARKLQLITMIVERLVDGDCGSKEYLSWYVRPKDDTQKYHLPNVEISQKSDLPNLLGKYYLNEETGQEEMITSKHTHLEGKTIKLRSALNCCLEDKHAICSKCFGELTYSIPKHFNLGHYCTTVMTEKLSQSILSTKHLTTSASSGAIILDEVASKLLLVKNNHYYFKPNVLNNKMKWTITVNQFEANGLLGLKSNVDIYKLSVNRVSLIKSIVLTSTNLKTGEINTYHIDIGDKHKRGSFTYEIIEHITNNGVKLDNEDNYVIELDNFNPKKPIIVVPEIEYDFSKLVDNISKKFDTISPEEDVIEVFLQTIFDLINTKLDLNIALLEVIVYAFTVASIEKRDFSLGRNSKDRKILKSAAIVPVRSLGVGYGWEKILNDLIFSPTSFYGYNAVDHPMDVVIKPRKYMLNKK